MAHGSEDLGIATPGLKAGIEPPGEMLKPVEAETETKTEHPSGRESYGRAMQILRTLAFVVYFPTCCFTIFVTQILGSWLYFVNKEWYYAYMAMTKRSFAIVITLMTNIWGPTTIRISGDESVTGQIRATEGGGVEFRFPERMVLIANHQIYTDWVYLWWVSYANRPGTHGHIYIILKESLKYIPIIGWGMTFYSFIFMSRKMATDQPRLTHRLTKLAQKKTDPTGKGYFDPMWLLLFPEGTNMSGNGKRKSVGWAKKTGLRAPEHVLLPRSTGIYFCLKALKGSVEYVYDCTVAYEGIARGAYGEEIFGLSSTYFQGQPPKSVNFHWRRFRVADIPLDDEEKFGTWLLEAWYEKDQMMEQYLTTGRLPASPGEKPYIETEVRTRYPWEILQVFTVVGICGLVWNNVRKAYLAAMVFMGLRA